MGGHTNSRPILAARIAHAIARTISLPLVIELKFMLTYVYTIVVYILLNCSCSLFKFSGG